jgi:hypothetical protein
MGDLTERDVVAIEGKTFRRWHDPRIGKEAIESVGAGLRQPPAAGRHKGSRQLQRGHSYSDERALTPARSRWRWSRSGLIAVFLVAAVLLISTRPLPHGVPLGVQAVCVLRLITTAMTAAMPVFLAHASQNEWSVLSRVH